MDPRDISRYFSADEDFVDDDEKSLADLLSEDQATSYFDSASRDFWPENIIKKFVTEPLVRRELYGAGNRCDSELVDYIVERAPRLFAITATTLDSDTRKLRAMKAFRSKGIDDRSLSAEFLDSSAQDSLSLDDRLTSLDLKLWRPAMKSRFREEQWKSLVPVFSTARSYYEFKPKTILPFTKMERNIKHGAFSSVHKVSIHKDHFRDDDPLAHPTHFAIKEIIPADNEQRRHIAQNWGKEVATLKTMNLRCKEHIVRFITAFTRGEVGRDMSYYIVFEWADGGSLQDLWAQTPRPVLRADLIKEAVTQLRGLGEALCAAHNQENGVGICHGDIKPDNILRFLPQPDKGFGTLKIGDWGLAKYHNTATVLRGENDENTTTKYGTPLYEPPEVESGQWTTMGLQYDVWSMGCVILELLIWLLYGYHEVKRFREEVRGGSTIAAPFYVVVKGKAKLRDAVVAWMGHMEKDPACAADTVMGELLKMVKTRLLVVELPPLMGQTIYNKARNPAASNQVSSAPTPQVVVNGPGETNLFEPERGLCPRIYRATSREFLDYLEVIDDKDLPEDYWLPVGLGFRRKGPPSRLKAWVQDAYGNLTGSHSATRKGETRRSARAAPNLTQLPVQDQNYLNDEWDIHLDNNFASMAISHIKSSPSLGLPELSKTVDLCTSCENLDFFGRLGFSVEYKKKDLEEKARSCDLCGLFWKTYQRYKGASSDIVRFESTQSTLRMSGSGPPVLSIFLSPNSKPRPGIQIGLPKLPKSGSEAHFDIIRQWLRLCDDKNSHPNCHTTVPSTKHLPKRLIDVGRAGDKIVRLWETSPGNAGEYVALSHPWGPAPHFVTNIGNLGQHKDGIKLEDLPATFRDAVITTRALDRRYLWIDSICIIQGPEGDFNTEARKMEAVFSSAYCVIAANRSHSHADGFLQHRRQREFVTLRQKSDGAPFYICENIDNFALHVLDSHLHRRGWVLQEHALARRTIFFTEHQTYWECGDGVRCETFTKMTNNLAAFLGDPNFPRIIMGAKRGEMIIRFQDLYRKYSALGFTKPDDRPIAVDGIQTRLLSAFETKGGFGVFDDGGASLGGLLRRSLLWHCPRNKELVRITFSPSRTTRVPSWSWMSYVGEIDYLQPEFGNFDWTEVQSPWSRSGRDVLRSDDAGDNMALSGEVRTITLDKASEGQGNIYFDIPSTSYMYPLRGLILGVEKGGRPVSSKLHYFILVAPTTDHEPDGSRVFNRIGAGYLPGRCISSRGERVKIY